MGLLLYKSNEMFSATQLIRQSKMIFDKIINKDIEKAIILRDGKPGFLLMDFEKYEKIMAEYEKLQLQISKQKKQKKVDTKQTTISTNIPIKIQHQEEIPKQITQSSTSIEINKNKIEKEPIQPPEKNIPKDDELKTQEQTADQEINAAMKSIDSMNFDDNMKNLAKEKIKSKILKARQEREKLLKIQEEKEKEQLKEELKLQVQIKKEKKKKEKELSEFWD